MGVAVEFAKVYTSSDGGDTWTLSKDITDLGSAFGLESILYESANHIVLTGTYVKLGTVEIEKAELT